MIPTTDVLYSNLHLSVSLFQSRNRATYDSNWGEIGSQLKPWQAKLFQSRNRETYDSNLASRHN